MVASVTPRALFVLPAVVLDGSTPRAGLGPVLVAYGSGALQGLSVVCLPASATVVQGELGLSALAYGALFVPQTAAAIVGALVIGPLARRFGAMVVLAFALMSHAAAMAALGAATRFDPTIACTFASALVGLGFGASAVPLNGLPGLLFPRRREAALVAMHTTIGAGFAVGPALLGEAIADGLWLLAPAALALANGAVAVVAFIGRGERIAVDEPERRAGRNRALPALVGVAILYALAEGTFSNWATVYLHDARGLDERAATLALSAFWAALAIGRLLVAALLTRVGALRIWTVLPVAMALVFVGLPLVDSPAAGVLAFAAAGLATSAVFPLTVSLATERAGIARTVASAWLTAALMIGVGIGTFALGWLRTWLSFADLYRIGALYPLAALALGSIVFRTGPRQ